MDVNQTRFHLVYGASDWYPEWAGDSPSSEPLFDWNADDATLSLHQQLFVFPRLSGQALLEVANRRGAGRDRFGNYYWIGETSDELRFLSGKPRATSEHFWSNSDAVAGCAITGDFFNPASPQPPPEITFFGLAVTPDHYLVAGMIQPPGLLIFDLYSGGPPSRVLWPSTVPFAPFDMAVTSDGGVLILDRANKLCWKLDRNLRVAGMRPEPAPSAAAPVFQPVNGTASRLPSCDTGAISLDLAAALAGTSDPVAIESLPDGSVLVLDNPPFANFSSIHRFQAGAEIGPPVSLAQALAAYVEDVPSADDPHPQAVRGYDFTFATNSSQSTSLGSLYLVQIYGDQSFAFEVGLEGSTLTLRAQPRYLPMRQFGGKGLIGAGANVYYDYQDKWVPLVEQPRPQYQLQAQLLLPQMSTAASPASSPAAFDGKQPGCIWHRIFLDACIPPGASVLVESRAADLQILLPSSPWQREPSPYLRELGAEIPYFKPQLRGSPDRVGTWELLFQNARGRYLQLRLTLGGNGRNTPRLQALRVYYPRFSYLRQYLPAVFQEDPVSASFLDRYLANVEGFYTVLEGRIAVAQALFDTRIVPAEYLDWLASWMSLALDPAWSEQTRRLVLSHAPQMFRERGTPNGIIRAIRLMLDASPDDSLFDESSSTPNGCSNGSAIFTVRIVERFLTRSSPQLGIVDTPSAQAPGVIASGTGSGSPWTTAQGAEPLNALYRCYLQSLYATIASLNTAWTTKYSGFDDPGLILPPVQPAAEAQSQDWRHFLRDALGFTYAPVTSADQGTYQAFLSSSYSTIGDLNATWSLTGTSVYARFDAIPLPASMPSGLAMLTDWIRFVSVALPVQQNAHLFTVLVPVSLTDTADVQQTKLAVAGRIAAIEKPAHTSFDVRPYWGMFRAGEARLGQDTLLGPGSRFAALVLGSGSLAAGNLAVSNPIYERDRKQFGGPSIVPACCGPQPQERCV